VARPPWWKYPKLDWEKGYGFPFDLTARAREGAIG